MLVRNLFASVAVALLAATSNVQAYPNYSPICVATVDAMLNGDTTGTHTSGPTSVMDGWTISLAKGTVSGQIAVTLAGTPILTGLVLRVQDSASQNPVGSFLNVPTGFDVKSVDQNGVSCGQSVIEHSVSTLAATTATFNWDHGTFAGAVNISAIVISTDPSDWTVIGVSATVNADGSFVVTGSTAPPAVAALQGIQQYRIYLAAGGAALGLVVLAVILQTLIKRQKRSK